MNFPGINIQGNIISSEIIEKIRTEDIKYQQASDFKLDKKSTVRDEIGFAWAAIRAHWTAFKIRAERLSEGESGVTSTRASWMVPFFQELGYTLQFKPGAEQINLKSYPISHRASNLNDFPVHIMGINDDLDKRRESGGPRLSPHALMQEYLNNSDHVYALVSNGRYLRLLRDATRLVRLSYLEFDLEKMMEEELYADFAILFRLLHATRMPQHPDNLEESPIEFYHQDSLASGSRIREKLSEAVENSIKLLANGFLSHPANPLLREEIQKNKLSPEGYYLLQLRLIYRFLFLIVTEERNLVYLDTKDPEVQRKRKVYYDFYSLERLRRLATRLHFVDAHKHDLWEGLKTSFQLFERSAVGEKLGIKPLGSGLFSPSALGMLPELKLTNEALLKVIRNLTLFENEQRNLVRVNYSDLDVEEFGSVYEGLLEYDAVFTNDNGQPVFSFVEGKGRSSSGSHYTPEELVKPLIKHSLDYIIEDKLKEQNKEVALLSIKVCDVACGSGHILLSAARRIATELARVRTGEDQPTPTAMRHAIRDAIKHCIYGVDKNPLAVELCKVALWLEAHNPGEPLGFLDHHIKCGDAIVGLAHRDELEKGIADEAFKTLPGDDKEIASSFAKLNKAERKERDTTGTQLKAEFDERVQDNVQEAMEEYGQFVKLPERTPEEVEAKQHAYSKFLNGKGYIFLKTMADTQVAQFFIPKTTGNKDRLITDAEFRQILRGYKSWQSPKTSWAIVVSQHQRFFHWFIEFPEVFQQGGFNCVLGNPPFLGGQKLSGTFGDYFLEFVKYAYYPIGAVDLVTFFFRRIFDIIRSKGFQSLISTNTISQGRARTDGLDTILSKGGTINHAVKSVRWPGKAAVEVSLVTITKQVWKNTFFLGTKEVRTITTYLDDADTLGSPAQLKCNENKSFQGSIVLGQGFILSDEEAGALIQKDNKNRDVIFPYLNGEDLNGSPAQIPSRSIINFFDFPLRRYTQAEWSEMRHEEKESINEALFLGKFVMVAPPYYGGKVASDYPDCLEWVSRLVRPERELNTYSVNARERWWLYERLRPELYKATSSLERVIVVAQVSKTVAFEFTDNNKVLDAKLIVFAFSDFATLGLLQSTIHNAWAWKYCTTMKSDLSYTPSAIFQTFPFPNRLPTNSARLSNCMKEYHATRRSLMLNLGLGLTKLYNLLHQKDLTTVDIEKASRRLNPSYEDSLKHINALRASQQELDMIVLESYGWNDIIPNHNFFDVDYLPENDRTRYTIHPEARREILKRLLELNHKIHAEEIKAGLWDKKKPAKVKKEKSTTQPIQETLFADNYNSMLEFKYDEGIYSISDVTEMIKNGVRLPDISKGKVTRWFKELAEADYEGLKGENKNDIENLRIGFHGLIELVVIAKLRDCGISLKTILTAREDLGRQTHKKAYPFATNDVSKILKVDAEGRRLFHQISKDEIVSLNKTGQYNLKFIVEFFNNIDFRNGLAIRFIPPISKGKIIIDPQIGDGKPVIAGKDIPAQTIWQIYNSTKNINNIKNDYGVTEGEIKAALAYFNE